MENGSYSVYFDNTSHGEDAYLSRIISDTSSLDIVLDGASCVGGSKASKLAHKVLTEQKITNKQDLIDAMEYINGELFTEEKNKKSITTLTACLKEGNDLYTLNLGDSPAWIFKDNKLEELTTLDDNPYMPNIITNAVGHKEKLKYHEKSSKLYPGDKLIIMSDGISDNLPEEEILKILQRAKSPEIATAR